MSSFFAYLDMLLFAVLPYLAMVIFLVLTIQRYRSQTFTYSSLSSQFLENQFHFWGMVPFHYGIITVLGGHVVAFLIPRRILAWNSVPLRLYVLEVSALIFGILTIVGLLNLIARRLTDAKAKTVTSTGDWVLLVMLAVQVFSGIYIAIFHGWGSSWFAAAATPYLRSLLTLRPDIAFIAAMPWMVKLHIVNAWIVIGLFPFTRLVHILVVPNPYLWRKPQLVRWNWDRKIIRQS
ncbi:MAG: respiratory nitrate reductase subunit gamma [Acidobacteria bacterium]|nr:respiratory nitrate reductase subunit gamma [Acidobacteriota bacterium]